MSQPPPDVPSPPAVDDLEQAERAWLEDVYCGDQMRELTIRSVLLGFSLAALMVTLNVYMGLKTTFAEGGALIACIAGFAVMKALGQVDRKRNPFNKLELNMTQTMAGAAGSLGDIVNVVPALFILGGFTGAVVLLHRPDGTPLIPTWWEIMAWCLFTSMLGVTFAVPMRKQLVVVDKLRFPTGTAAAETIKVMYAKGEVALKQARALAIVGGSSFLLTFLRDWKPASWIQDKPGLTKWMKIHSAYTPESITSLFTTWSPAIFGCPMGSLTLGIAVSPMLLGAGFLIGPRIGVSLILGMLVAWVALPPFLLEAGILDEIAAVTGKPTALSYGVIVRWTMWPALGLMIAAGVGSMLLKYSTVTRAFLSMAAGLRGGKDRSPASHLELPFLVWLAGLLIAAGGIEWMLVWRFGVAWWVGLMVIPVAFLLSVIAMRSMGETDIGPAGSMGSVTQIFYGLIHPGHVGTNLLTGGVSAAAAGESCYMMVDLKAGQLLGSTPRRLAYAQYLGIFAGALMATPIFLLFLHTYGIGNADMPAPNAIAWAGLAQMMASGASGLPPHAGWGLLAGGVVGMALTVNDTYKVIRWKWMPSAMGLGIAMIIPAFYSVTLFAGSMILAVLMKKAPAWVERYGASIAAGGIAGEGIAGLTVALLIFLHLM